MNRDLLATIGTVAAVIVGVAVWGIVVVVTVIRGDPIPAELWAVPGVLIGSILAAFRSADFLARRRRPPGTDDTAEDNRT